MEVIKCNHDCVRVETVLKRFAVEILIFPYSFYGKTEALHVKPATACT
jgi:hypothetical protein